MNMKKTLIAFTLAAAIPAAVLAADGERGPGHRGPNVERMAERLDLTAEQQDQIRALFESHKAERETLRAKMRADMEKVLTPEQLARMDQMREQRREHRKDRWEHRHGRRCDDEERRG